MQDFLKKHSKLIEHAEYYLATTHIPVAIHDYRNARFYETRHFAPDGHGYLIVLAVNINGLYGIVSEPIDMELYIKECRATKGVVPYNQMYRTKIREKYRYGNDEQIQDDIEAVFKKGIELHETLRFGDDYDVIGSVRADNH